MNSQKLLKLLFSILWGLIGATAVSILLLNVPALPIERLSYQPYVITSASMEPTIMVGDLIFIKAQPEYAPQDIVTYQRTVQSTPITHRILEEDEDSDGLYITQGDNNEDPDKDPVALSEILGKYEFHIPKIGYFLVFAKSTTGIVTFAVIGIVLYSLETLLLQKPAKKTE